MHRSLILVAFVTGCGAGGPDPEAPVIGTPGEIPDRPPPTATSNDESDTPTESASGCPDGMVEIPDGTFWMGSLDGKGRADERPRSQLDVPKFCMDVTEVTVGDYKSCLDNEICKAAADTVWTGKHLPDAQQKKLTNQCTISGDNPELPLNCITNEEAVLYCQWKGRRLPTETELEYVATSGADGLKFPWGDDAPDANNTCWKQKEPCAVKARPPGAFGLYDIIGNLNEWTSTEYGKYGGTPIGGRFVVRGGSYKTAAADDLRPQRRFSRGDDNKDVDLGFRCAKDL